MSDNGTSNKVFAGEAISTDGRDWELPVTDKVKLLGLNSYDYEHPLDRQALQALEATPGLGRAISVLISEAAERRFRIDLMATGIRVNDRNFPQLNKAFHETCEILDMPYRPQLYISNDPRTNAFAIGAKEPMVAFTSAAISEMGTDELRYIIGHELGHIKSSHTTYLILVAIIRAIREQPFAQLLPTLPLVAFQGVYFALMKWARMAEFTCDRAGLLACQNLDAAIRAKIKLAGLPRSLQNRDVVNEFIQQARDFEDFDHNMFDRILKDVSVLDRTHPWTVVRAKELLVWTETGEYGRIIDLCKERAQTSIRGDARFCPYCGTTMDRETSFCGGCGVKVDGAESAEPEAVA